MRSSRAARLVALTFGAAALAACAGKRAPVCQPLFSLAAPAYGCAAGAPSVVAVEDQPLEEPPAYEPPPAPVLASLGDGSIDLAEKIGFETGSAVLLRGSEAMFDQVVQVLTDHPEITKIRIDGHTDSKGSKAKNLRLSQDRADAVRFYLEQRGVDADRMSAKGFGATRPIADNRTASGRDQNRRVEITILHRAP